MLIVEILKKNEPSSNLTVKGWVASKRTSKNCSFLDVFDGSCQKSLQVVVPAGVSDDVLESVMTGAAIEAQGEWICVGEKMAWELQAKEIKLIGASDKSYPLQKKGHSFEFLRTVAHLRPRTNTFRAVFRMRHVLAKAVHDFFDAKHFVWAHTPILSASDCEGAGELFRVSNISGADKSKERPFFGKDAFLAVSGQLQGEYLASAMSRIYTFGPTFRAENSNTSRHLAEFWMVEPEAAFFDLNDLIGLCNDWIKTMVSTVLRECPDEIDFFANRLKSLDVSSLERVVASPLARISYSDAVKELSKIKDFAYPVEWGMDLQTEHERYLSEVIFKGPVAVTDYPADIKAFYMRMNDDGKTVAAMDFLVPGVGEMIGGSQREERLDHLIKRMAHMKIPQDELQWYLDLRRFGSVPHSGCGLGFERLLMYLTGMSNIRDVVMSPRAPGLIEF